MHVSEAPMRDSRKPESDMSQRRFDDLSTVKQASRRAFLKSGAALAAGGFAAQILPERALAQSDGPAEQSPVAPPQGQRRFLLKDGIVLRRSTMPASGGGSGNWSRRGATRRCDEPTSRWTSSAEITRRATR
jgi:hypothetical protein